MRSELRSRRASTRSSSPDAALQALRNKRLNALISEDLAALGVEEADLDEVREQWRDHFGPEVV